MATTQTKGFSRSASAARPAAQTQTAAPAAQTEKSYEDHYGDAVEMESAAGRKSKYIKFTKDISDEATGLFIPKGTVFDFESFQDIYDRAEQPSQKLLDWLNAQQEPYVTPKGATLTKFARIKKAWKPEK